MNMSDRFDLEDGRLYWKKRQAPDAIPNLFNSGHIGQEAGGSNPEIITINRYKYEKADIIRAIKYEQSTIIRSSS